MEFVDRVTHCEYPGCGQGDFLPFKCMHCSGHYCLSHKSALAHECAVGLAYKDMTSLDCPICNLPVKFTRAEDPDGVWRRHYAEACSQKPAASLTAPVAKCRAPGCFTSLGPSNTFKCPQCKQNVCLTHRRVEDHACPAVAQASKPQQQPKQAAAAAAARRIAAPSATSSAAAAASKSKGSATTTSSRRQEDEAPLLSCPFCGLTSYRDSGALQQHINRDHPDPGSARPVPAPAPVPVPAPASGAGLGSGPEECPQCRRRFPDVMALIAHVEQAHGSGGGSGASGSGADCSLS